MKSPITEALRNRLTDGVAAANIYLSKQFTVAETNQLYTISLKSRNKTALVSPMRCEYGLGLWQNIRKVDQKVCYKEWTRVLPLTPTTRKACLDGNN